MLNRRVKQRILLIIALMLVTYFASFYQPPTTQKPPLDNQTIIHTLFEQKESNVQVEIDGEITRLLDDDLRGGRHQRFIIDVGNGHTVLIAHNIDLAPKIPDLKVGNDIHVFGEYEWNKQGGVIHWTHHDPKNKHPHGWIKYQGQLYQ